MKHLKLVGIIFLLFIVDKAISHFVLLSFLSLTIDFLVLYLFINISKAYLNSQVVIVIILISMLYGLFYQYNFGGVALISFIGINVDYIVKRYIRNDYLQLVVFGSLFINLLVLGYFLDGDGYSLRNYFPSLIINLIVIIGIYRIVRERYVRKGTYVS